MIFPAFSLREKCPSPEFFLVRVFPYSVRMRENTDQKKLRIWALFMQCSVCLLLNHDFIYQSVCIVFDIKFKDFFSKCDQISCFLLIWSHLLKKSSMENFIFLCSVSRLVSVVSWLFSVRQN